MQRTERWIQRKEAVAVAHLPSAGQATIPPAKVLNKSTLGGGSLAESFNASLRTRCMCARPAFFSRWQGTMEEEEEEVLLLLSAALLCSSMAHTDSSQYTASTSSCTAEEEGLGLLLVAEDCSLRAVSNMKAAVSITSSTS